MAMDVKRFTLFENLTNSSTQKNLVATLKSALSLTPLSHLCPDWLCDHRKGHQFLSLCLTGFCYKLINTYKYISNNAKYKISALWPCSSIYIIIISFFWCFQIYTPEREVYINTEEKVNFILHSSKVLQGKETQTAEEPWCWSWEDHFASMYFSSPTTRS